ncbi:MAG: hypothetical protein Q9209_007980 [Squamulea sp. 1 TL-2023]
MDPPRGSRMRTWSEPVHSANRSTGYELQLHSKKNVESSTEALYCASSESDPRNIGSNDLYSDPISVLEQVTRISALQDSLKTLDYLVRLLQWSGIPGPVMFLSDRESLGQGSQFKVYKQKAVWPDAHEPIIKFVAAKEPKYFLNSDHKLNLADSASRRQLHDMCLEVVALAHPTLQKHPNIINMLGWGKDDAIWHRPLTLVLELATSDLKTEMEDWGRSMTWRQKYQICWDIGSGLDAIHDCRLAHGDLKAENVLICMDEAGKVVAKIADFGFCVDENYETAQMMIGTPGWQAPEIENGDFQLAQLSLADNFSYGLLVWSVMLLDGKCPPHGFSKSRSTAATEAFQSKELDLPLPTRKALVSVAESLLNSCVSERSAYVSDIMFSGLGVEDGESASTSSTNSVTSSGNNGSGTPISQPCEFEPFEWELRRVDHQLHEDMLAAFDSDPTSLPGDLILSLALTESTVNTRPEKLLQLICVSAYQNYEPAQALMELVFEYVRQRIPEDITYYLQEYLGNAVATGSLVAASKLQRRSYEVYEDAKHAFRVDGGFNQYYSHIRYDTMHVSTRDIILSDQALMSRYGHGLTHWCAIFGSRGDLDQIYHPDSRTKLLGINTQTSTKETAIYLSCLRGAWEITEALLEQGADPSIACTGARVTCLHWLFTFDESKTAKAACEFVRRGTNINALSDEAVPLYHFPFSLPRGTPLHWAVTIQCHASIKALLENGADPFLRNANDPYIDDERIRPPRFLQEPVGEPRSVLDHPTLGLTPLDIAVIIRDPFIFQYLQSSMGKIDLNITDEEGLALVHRLSRSRQDLTMLDIYFDRRVFQGSPEVQRNSLESLISTMEKLGADFNMPVKDLPRETANHVKSGVISDHTPLMLAMSCGDFDLIEMLIDHGATVQYKNQLGKTALMCLGDAPHLSTTAAEEHYLRAMKVLICHGGDIHSASTEGQTAIQAAVIWEYLSIIELLLEHGVDPEQHIHSIINKNIWAYLAKREVSDKHDVAVADLLTRYIFPLTDRDKRNRIIELADESGASLLHYFSQSGMVACVTALLDASCVINPQRRDWKYRINDDGEVIGRIEWNMTPLDSALVAELDIRNPKKRNSDNFGLSGSDRDVLCKQVAQIALLLRQAGGVEVRESTLSEVENNDNIKRHNELTPVIEIWRFDG